MSLIRPYRALIMLMTSVIIGFLFLVSILGLPNALASEKEPWGISNTHHSTPLGQVVTLNIVLDGVASAGEWHNSRKLITNSQNVLVTPPHVCNGITITASNVRPIDFPCYARTGYDIVGFWGHYQGAEKNWYFRLDVDGAPGDSDSVQGSDSANLGAGTDGDDGGLLMQTGAADEFGFGSAEQYTLRFGPDAASFPGAAKLTGNPSGPGVIIPLSAASTLSGSVAYGAIPNPGVSEWRIDKSNLFPPGIIQPELWAAVGVGSSEDKLSEDDLGAFRILGIDIANSCPPPYTIGSPTVFPIAYTINGASSYPIASNVVITAPIPAGTTYVSGSCSTGAVSGTCGENGGVIYWNLGTLSRGASGTVTFELIINVTSGIDTDAYMTIAEGLRDYALADGCPAIPPPEPTPEPKPTPEPGPTDTPPPPPPSPTPTWTPTPLPTSTPAIPSILPETGANTTGGTHTVYLLIALIGGAAILGGKLWLHKQN